MTNHQANSSNSHGAAIRKITFLALAVNISLTIVKFACGIFGHSQAVVADACHSASDLSTDLLILFGVGFWSAPADEEHPYGHLRIEAIVTAMIGFVLAYIGFRIGWHSLVTIDKIHMRPPSWFASLGPILTIVIKTWLYRVSILFGKKIQSSAVIANANHQLSDVLSSVPALVGSVVPAIWPSLVIVDHLGAFIVSLFLLHLAWEVTKPALLELTDLAASRESRREMVRLIKSVEGVKSVQNLRSRKIGSKYFVDAKVFVHGDLSVNDGHQITERVRSSLVENGPDVADAIIHLVPFSADTLGDDLDAKMALSMMKVVEGEVPRGPKCQK